MDAKQLEEKQKQRFLFLQYIYDKSNGDEKKIFDTEEVGKELGFDLSAARTTAQYLVGENLLRDEGSYTLFISHWGIVEMEEKIAHPDKPTEHFPINVTLIIQTGGVNIVSGGETKNEGKITGRDNVEI